MDAHGFLNTAPVKRALERAARITGTGLAVHRRLDGEESELLGRCGGRAEACAYVSRLPWGPQSCRRSRAEAAEAAIRREKPVPFVCHMGFSCVAVATDLPLNGNAVVTLGPFCPAEAPGSLQAEAKEGLAKLEQRERGQLPFDLGDIPLVSAEAVPSVAEWIAETLQTGFAALREPAPLLKGDLPDARRASRTQAAPALGVHQYQIGDILAALAAGDKAQARILTQRALEATRSRIESTPRVRQAATITLVAAVVQAAEHAGVDTTQARASFPSLHAATLEATEPASLSKAAMRVLRQLKTLDDGAQASCAALSAIIDRDLAQGITLDAAAKELGENPSTMTRRLQRTIGMSFSEFVARRRVDRAKELLCSTGLRVADVAHRVGLNDASNLGKLFRKFERQSPGDYRKQAAREAKLARTGTNR